MRQAALPPEPAGGRVLARSEGGDGRQRVLRLSRPDGTPYVLKCYGRKSGRARAAVRRFGSWALAGKTSTTPSARRRTEQEALALWRAEGFDVPAILDTAPPPGIDAPSLALEWIPGATLAEHLRRSDLDAARAGALLAALARAHGRRHARALETGDPRLLMEHPTLEHVLVCGERLVHFDLEIAYRGRRPLERLARREIAGFLHSLAKTAGDEARRALFRAYAGAYPERVRLESLARELARLGAVPASPWLVPLLGLAPARGRRARRTGMVRPLETALAESPAPGRPGFE